MDKMPPNHITVLARSSPLSQRQVEELQRNLAEIGADVQVLPQWVESIGDKDKETSLRSLNKTDFFTRELDQLLLASEASVAVHSAKDLPEPLPEGLEIVAITAGVDSSDSLVLKEGTTVESLPSGAVIATSSERREDAVRELRDDLSFVDIRGTIGERLAKLDYGEVAGVVIAEAALIRLELTQLNRVTLPGNTTPLQGQLAVVARAGDEEMRTLFRGLDVRQEARIHA